MTLSLTPFLTLAVAALLVGLLFGLAGGLALGHWVFPHCPERYEDLEDMPTIYPEVPPCDCEADYYRGIFDNWAWISKMTGQPVDLWTIVRATVKRDWYAKPSPGWVWPVPTPVPAPGVDG